MKAISIPEFALVLLIGTSGSGKTTFAHKHFQATEVISSDYCRGLVSDDENSLTATSDAFDVVRYIATKRLKNKKLTVIDATNVRKEDRRQFLQLAREYHCLAVAIVLDLPEEVCHERNKLRADRQFGLHVVRNQKRNLKRSLKGLQREGLRYVHKLSTVEDVDAVTIERQRLWTDKCDEHGPFDIIGDVHGCCDELETLLEKLGYVFDTDDAKSYSRIYKHPEGRQIIFVGDLIDRGPRSIDSIGLVKNMVELGSAFCMPGNHDVKLVRYLRGKNVKLVNGLETTAAEFEALAETISVEEMESYKSDIASFLDGLVSHAVFDKGDLVVAHAGLKESMQGRASGAVRSFALFGDTTGELDEYGLPVRQNWAADYRGEAFVVYGHTPVFEAMWLNNTVNIDTGCVFGGKLTALRYPEKETVSVASIKQYAEPKRPLEPTVYGLTKQQEVDGLLDLADVTGKRIIHTRLRSSITIREENSIAALEVMSRFAINPKWLIHLPPTMAAPETSQLAEYLEHPEQAFDYYQKEGLETVICQEKHMGSRACIVLCKDVEAAQKRFGIKEERFGVIYTRTGRQFFNDEALELALLEQLQSSLTTTNFWEDFNTDWVLLDTELMPWSQKAQSLLSEQYAAVGTAAQHSLSAAQLALETAKTRGLDVGNLQEEVGERLEATNNYIASYAHYCWPVNSLADIKLAPFHILATEAVVHTDKSHQWHMETIKKYVVTGEATSLQATNYKQVELASQQSVDEAITWWKDMTSRGGEGMVVKPLDYISIGKRAVVQPAIKVRGREYLRIIYGPDYTVGRNLERLRKRNVSAKRSLALREFALGVEALERFVAGQPLRKVHECVFAVLALESEPVDPRL